MSKKPPLIRCCSASLLAGGLSRREFMRRAGILCAAAPAAATASAGLSAPLSATSSRFRPTGPEKFFPYSGMPEAVRERLANFLLRKTRITDPDFDDYHARTAKSLSPKDNFLVVTSSEREINAFAHYGGLIVLMRGMWETAESEDALLGIVAHEMGHIKLDHFKSKRELDKTVSAVSIPLLIAGLLAGSPEVRESIIVGGSGIITGQIYGHSRELEHEADVVGLQILSETRRDGRQMAKLLGSLAGAPNEYISTHPAPRRRAAYIRDRLLSLPQYKPGDGEDFLLLRQKLAVLDKVSPDLIQSKRRELASESGAKRTALQFALFLAGTKTGNENLAAEMDAALSKSDHPFIIAARADHISAGGGHRKAADMFESARKTNMESLPLALGQITAARRAGEFEKVLKLREDLPPEISARADVLREAAGAEESMGAPAEANMLLAEAHIKQGAFERALKQLEIAEKHDMTTRMLSRSNKLKNSAKRELTALNKK